MHNTVRDHLSRLMTKTIKWPLRPAKTRISLGWSESSLGAQIILLVLSWGYSAYTSANLSKLLIVWLTFWRCKGLLMKNIQLLKSGINNDIAIANDMQAVFHTDGLIVITLDKCWRLLNKWPCQPYTDGSVGMSECIYCHTAMCNFMADNLSQYGRSSTTGIRNWGVGAIISRFNHDRSIHHHQHVVKGQTLKHRSASWMFPMSTE